MPYTINNEASLPIYDDQDVIKSWEWFLSFMSAKKWEERKSLIEEKIAVPFRTSKPLTESVSKGILLADKNDAIGWYLYLIEMQINHPYKFEPFQGVRVLPIFKRLGEDLNLVKKIKGIDKKVKELLYKKQSEADAILFEILIALLWKKNGYDVEFIPEKSQRKSPDILATKESEVYNIECKRQSKTSDYAYRETKKRQDMLSFLGEALIKRNILLNITFHTELVSLPDTYLKDLLEKKLDLAVAGKIVSNQEVDIELEFINISNINEQLKTNYVKLHSPLLNYLLSGRKSDHSSFTCGVNYKEYYRIGEGTINNLFLSKISGAFGVICTCDAKEAISAKARDIKKQIYKALKQFNSSETAIIHVGMETYDGPEVEAKRFRKIEKTIESLNPIGSNLKWIFCHFFQSYATIDDQWFFDETTSTISAYDKSKPPPINNNMIVVPEDGDLLDDISHWERPLP